MDTPDAIPSDDDRVVIPDHLLAPLRAAADRNLRQACDLAFPPDQRDEVINAVHLIDGFEEDRVTAAVALAMPLALQ